MMCPACTKPHIYAECRFPQSCTCQHRPPEIKQPLNRKNYVPSPGTNTDQEQHTHAADRLDP